MQLIVFCLSVLLPLNCVRVISAHCNSEPTKKEELKEDLFCNYDEAERPVVNHANTTNVTLQIILKNIDYDMHTSGMILNFWLSATWIDQHLTWKPENYGGIDEWIVESHRIWMPDLSIYNRVEQSDNARIIQPDNCLLRHTGEIICVSPNNHEILCQPNLKYFPFDVQNCTMTIGSWIYRGEEVYMHLPAVDPVSTTDYMDTGEWKLTNISTHRVSGVYACCPNTTFPYLNYNFFIERHAGNRICMVVVPALTMLLMTMHTFFLDIAQAERTFVIYINIITHMLFSEYIGWMIPISGPIPPVISIYTRDSLILVAMQMVLTIIERKLLSCQRASPVFIGKAVEFAMDSRAIQLLFIYEGSLKNVAVRLGDDDGQNIVENVQTTSKETSKDWIILANILDRLVMIIYAICYCIFVIAFIP